MAAIDSLEPFLIAILALTPTIENDRKIKVLQHRPSGFKENSPACPIHHILTHIDVDFYRFQAPEVAVP